MYSTSLVIFLFSGSGDRPSECTTFSADARMFSTISLLRAGLSVREMGAELKTAGEGEDRFPMGRKLGGVVVEIWWEVPGDMRLGVALVVEGCPGEEEDVDAFPCCHLPGVW